MAHPRFENFVVPTCRVSGGKEVEVSLLGYSDPGPSGSSRKGGALGQVMMRGEDNARVRKKGSFGKGVFSEKSIF